jgi:hypothetical protein
MNVPDWLWQNIVSDLLADALKAAAIGLLAWIYRKLMLMQRKPVTISMNPANLTAEGQPVYVSASIQAKSTVKATATVIKPSLARRLEELAAWYLHVS